MKAEQLLDKLTAGRLDRAGVCLLSKKQGAWLMGVVTWKERQEGRAGRYCFGAMGRAFSNNHNQSVIRVSVREMEELERNRENIKREERIVSVLEESLKARQYSKHEEEVINRMIQEAKGLVAKNKAMLGEGAGQ